MPTFPAPERVAPDPAIAALLPAYLTRRAEDARLLAAALQVPDFGAIGAIGHRLKGLGSTYGHDAISTIGRSLEEAAAGADAPRAAGLLAQYQQYLADLD